MTRKHSLASITVRKTLLETLARRGITGPHVEAIRRGLPRDRLSRAHGASHIDFGKRRTKRTPIRRHRVGARPPRTQHVVLTGASLQALARSKTRKPKNAKLFTSKQRTLLARRIVNAQTKKIKGSLKKHIQFIRRSKMAPQTKKNRIAMAQKDANNAIRHFKSKLSQIQRAGRTMLGKIRATSALTSERKRQLQIQVSNEMKRRMEQSI